MIYKNLIIFKKLVRYDGKENYIKKNIIKNNSFRKFYVFFTKNYPFSFIRHE